MLTDELVEIADGLSPDLRSRNEAAHSQIDQHAAFYHLRYGGFDNFVALVRFDYLLPRLECTRTPLGEKERSVHLVDAVNHDFERVADPQQFGIDGERELAEGKDAFGFAADVDEHFVLIFLNDGAGEYLAFVENLERFFVKALLER